MHRHPLQSGLATASSRHIRQRAYFGLRFSGLTFSVKFRSWGTVPVALPPHPLVGRTVYRTRGEGLADAGPWQPRGAARGAEEGRWALARLGMLAAAESPDC